MDELELITQHLVEGGKTEEPYVKVLHDAYNKQSQKIEKELKDEEVLYSNYSAKCFQEELELELCITEKELVLFGLACMTSRNSGKSPNTQSQFGLRGRSYEYGVTLTSSKQPSSSRLLSFKKGDLLRILSQPKTMEGHIKHGNVRTVHKSHSSHPFFSHHDRPTVISFPADQVTDLSVPAPAPRASSTADRLKVSTIAAPEKLEAGERSKSHDVYKVADSSGDEDDGEISFPRDNSGDGAGGMGHHRYTYSQARALSTPLQAVNSSSYTPRSCSSESSSSSLSSSSASDSPSSDEDEKHNTHTASTNDEDHIGGLTVLAEVFDPSGNPSRKGLVSVDSIFLCPDLLEVDCKFGSLLHQLKTSMLDSFTAWCRERFRENESQEQIDDFVRKMNARVSAEKLNLFIYQSESRLKERLQFLESDSVQKEKIYSDSFERKQECGMKRYKIEERLRALPIQKLKELDSLVAQQVDTILAGLPAISLLKQQMLSNCNNAGDGALHLACARGYSSTVKVLLRAGASMIMRDELDQTPFHVAVKHGRLEILEQLILRHSQLLEEQKIYSKGGKLSSRRQKMFKKRDKRSGSTGTENSSICNLDAPSMHALEPEEVVEDEVVQMTREQILGIKSRTEWTLLHTAVHFQHRAVAQWLIKQGAQVDAVDIVGRSCLHLAAEVGDVEMTLELLESPHKLDPFLLNTQNETPLLTAINHKQEGIVKIYINRGVWLSQSQILGMLNQTKGKEQADLALSLLTCLEPQIAQFRAIAKNFYDPDPSDEPDPPKETKNSKNKRGKGNRSKRALLV